MTGVTAAPARTRALVRAGTSRIGRLASSGSGRIAGISASLVGTQALTSVLGLAFWTLAARQFATAEVGVAGAAVALMMLLGSLGSLGFGTALIARLPLAVATDRRRLVRTCLAAAAVAGTLLGAVVPAAALALGAGNLAPVAGSAWPLAGLAVGTGLTAVVMVLDQAVLTIGLGTLQLERNVVASSVKLVVLLGLALGGATGGMTILLAWTVGNLLSLPLVSWRTRGGRAAARGRLIDPALLRGIGRLAVSHHALNVSLQAALQLLPVLVTVLVSARANAGFNAALMISGFVFALPYAISVGLFAAARGDASEVVTRMRFTIPFGIAVSVAADLVLLPLAGPVLHLFGPQYAADGAVLLRLVVLAGIPFVIKDHFIALRRVQGRTDQALAVSAGFLVVELAAACAGAVIGGAVGLCAAWLSVLVLEAVVLAIPLRRAYRVATAGDAPAVAAAPVRTAAVEAREERATRPARRLTGPVLLLMSLGVLIMALAADAGRQGATGPGPQLLWYAGLTVVFVPAAVRVLARSTRGAERVVTVVALGLMLQVSRLVLAPTSWTFHDELIHANTLRMIEASGRLFAANPLLPVSGFYPGLEIATDAVHALTGLPPFASGVAVLLAARLVAVLAVVGLVAAIGGSVRAGAVGALVYLANPQLLFFNSQYSYQTLALPLAVLCAYLVAAPRRRGPLTLLAAMAATAAVVLTHHLTAVLLVGGYLLWLAATLVRGTRAADGVHRVHRHGIPDRVALAVLSTWGAALVALTVLVPGNPIRSYLGAIAGSSSTELFDLGRGGRPKTLFADGAGSGPALPEQVLLIASVLLSTAALVLVLALVRRSWRRSAPLGLALGVVGLLYPVVPAGHLTSATAEVGDRASGFVYLGLAAAVGTWWWTRRRSGRARALLTAAVTVVFLGGVVLGSGPASGQLPGPYQVAADARSVDAANVAAAEWERTDLPGDSTVYGDRVSGLLAAADGGQRTVLHVSTGLDLSRLLLAPDTTAEDLALIRRSGLRYLIVDTRLADGLPHQQYYIESGEYGLAGRTRPVSPSALDKFDSVPGVDRLYDNGSIVIYGVRGAR